MYARPTVQPAKCKKQEECNVNAYRCAENDEDARYEGQNQRRNNTFGRIFSDGRDFRIVIPVQHGASQIHVEAVADMPKGKEQHGKTAHQYNEHFQLRENQGCNRGNQDRGEGENRIKR